MTRRGSYPSTGRAANLCCHVPPPRALLRGWLVHPASQAGYLHTAPGEGLNKGSPGVSHDSKLGPTRPSDLTVIRS